MRLLVAALDALAILTALPTGQDDAQGPGGIRCKCLGSVPQIQKMSVDWPVLSSLPCLLS